MLRRATDMRTNAATALPTNLLISTKKNWPGTIVSNVLVTSGYIIRLLGDANALYLSYKFAQTESGIFGFVKAATPRPRKVFAEGDFRSKGSSVRWLLRGDHRLWLPP